MTSIKRYGREHNLVVPYRHRTQKNKKENEKVVPADKKVRKVLLCSEINLYLQPERLVWRQNPFV